MLQMNDRERKGLKSFRGAEAAGRRDGGLAGARARVAKQQIPACGRLQEEISETRTGSLGRQGRVRQVEVDMTRGRGVALVGWKGRVEFSKDK